MRKFYVIILMFLACILNNDLKAQEGSDSETSNLLKGLPSDIFSGNFAVPDAPAFRLLSTYPSKILRPSDVKDFAVGLSDFGGSDNVISLKSFAVEFSPALLIRGKNLSLLDYQKRSWIYRTRLSAAIHRSDEGSKATKVAVGIRLSLIDDSDLRNNIDYISNATDIAAKITDVYKAARIRVGPYNPLKINPEEEKQIKEIISAFKKNMENEKWNKRILEFAVAASATSSNSQGKNIKVDKIAGWSTYGHSFGTWGQLLIGLNFASEKDLLNASDGFKTTGSLSTRFYIGRNQYKMFAEGQVSMKENIKSNYLFNGGGEINFFANIWLVFSAGAEYIGSTKKADLVTNIKLKYGF